MDALSFEVAVAAGCIAVATAVRYRKPKVRRAAVPLMATRPAVRGLRRRHRRLVRAIVDHANECIERHPDGSFEAFTARETLRNYLPETLAAYRAVPRGLRRVRRAGRPSADDELSSQLWTLHGELERIAEADAEAGASRMAANGAFLGERFVGPGSSRMLDHPSPLSRVVDALETAFRRP